ncbi:4-hydroxythreonine-4-phosphate dehydrogenase PdxA [Actomonas aquatica]|uniref:4-hydroxythreonine-4-phosphate dehydrogenase PdxA n=1 Tax=Actomonas aquatica TaxID=2866162 RepID=A0ABZ1CCR1_9BACT|nr:4-hydroxythreonine-4-phosphate dehydrogenase PdxA [Opitutus sp. WL0086]WRQ89222.1 4-hydroxythreonine-4-phosphate dehydrogenase PdxA [Opitutus sp. WL0086]
MKPLAFTCGDPAGVGPEIIARWLAEHPDDVATGAVTVLGPARWLESLPAGVGRIAVGADDHVAVPGQPEAAGARAAWEAMRVAAEGCVSGRFAGVVTGPVSKAQLAAVGYQHPGQTEFFAESWGGEPVMGFRSDQLRVVLATWHVPLTAVSAALTPAAIERAVRAAVHLCAADGIATPRVAVCGLNPHAGEDGLLGGEEQAVIDPTLDGLRAELPGLSRALPGDTVFGRALRGEFDAVVAMYHDQGLAPLKTIDFDNAVNVTLGLPFVRTSPDHGTAFGIAGRGVASATSFTRAVELARRLSA